MSVDISIKKDFGNFRLDIEYKGGSRRLGILGASGSGKSLTLRSIAGIETPDSGHIVIDGRVLFDSGKKVNMIPQKRKTGYMFQNLALFDNMSVEKNIRAGIKGNTGIAKAKEIMEKFSLTNLSDRLPRQLSQGQRQRTALARIIASEPDIILFDEPFSSLDFYMRDEMQKSIMDILEDFKGTVITVSHSFDELYAMSDELIVIDNGSVFAYGKTEDIFNYPPNRVCAALTGCENIAAAECTDNKIYIPDWDIVFTSDNKNVKYAAVRANSFSLAAKEDMLCFDVKEPEIKREPFGCTVYFKTSEKAAGRMCFKLRQKILNAADVPDKIYIDRKDLLIIS